MSAKQTIVIIGAGYTGKTIATHLANGNFHMLLCDKDHTKAAALAIELKDAGQGCDVEAMQCSFESAWEADIVVLALHYQAQEEVAEIIKDVINQKILVSMVYSAEEIIGGLSSAHSQAEALQVLLPNTKIISIFNEDTLVRQPAGKNITRLLITGNDDKAVGIVSGILESVGINPKRVEHLSAIPNGNNL